MTKYKMSMISYSNTIPLRYGIAQSEYLQNTTQIIKDVPSECAHKLQTNQVDLGLVSVAMIPQIPNAQIITDFCIGAVDNVLSVELLSDCPINNITKIYLDPDSRSSNMLTRLMCEKYWKIKPVFEYRQSHTDFAIGKTEAAVLIGDCAINAQANYKFDLAKEWINQTELPFVFACWVANKPLDAKYIEELNRAMIYGIANTDDAINNLNKNFSFDIEKYLKVNINYNFDEKKRQALQIFMDYARIHKEL